ncbi:MAG TPA: DapH/DapD/GlmU-related protein [Thermoanaerobaculia bacterium]|nr:DapH/DapD/GlmU-related protein [Thermoanaerobaculia bacterium]
MALSGEIGGTVIDPVCLGPCTLGEDCQFDPGVYLAYPCGTPKCRRRNSFEETILGRGCVVRSHSVIYRHSSLGDGCHVAHNVVVREHATLGAGCVLGIGTVIREGACLGRNVRLMEHVVICEDAELGDDIFVGPGVTFVASRHMPGALLAAGTISDDEAGRREGLYYYEAPTVRVGNGVRIGAGSVVFPGLSLGEGSVIAAGSVVSQSIGPHLLAAGNPARPIKRVKS